MKTDYLTTKQLCFGTFNKLKLLSSVLLIFGLALTGYSQTTFNGTDPGAPFDVTSATSTAVSTLSGTIGTDYVITNVTIDISHTWVSDLDIFLIAPDGNTVLELTTDNGSSGDNYTNTQFQDDAPTSITSGTPPFTGIFRPEGGTFAAAFDGVDVNGPWQLFMTDDASPDPATFNSFSITFDVPPSCVNPMNLVAGNFSGTTADLSWDTEATATLGYQWVVMNAGDMPAVDGSEVNTGVTAPGMTMDTASGLIVGQGYDAYVRSICDQGEFSDWSTVQTFALPPANDDFVNAISVVCGGNYTGSTVNATLDESSAQGNNADMDAPNVWYSYTGSGAAEFVTLDLCDSDYDTSILVFTGSSGNLTLVADNDDDDDDVCGLQSVLTFTSDGNTTYWIVVEGWNSTSVGNYDLDVTCVLVPDCLEPSNLSAGNFTATTADLSWDVESSATLGYQWVVMNAGDAPAVDGSEAATGVNAPGMTMATASGLVVGQSYDAYVRSICDGGVFSDWSDVESFTMPPANDNAANAIAVVCDGNYAGSTDGATSDVAPSANVWYSYTGSGSTETISLDLCDSDYDTRLRVYTGTPGNLTQIGVNDDSCGVQSQLSFTSDGSTTYYISVGGFGTSVGNYDLDIFCEIPEPAPANDNVADAIPVVCDGNYTGSTENATVDVAPSQNVWYSYTGSGSPEIITLDLCDSDYDTRLRVYTGTPGNLTQIGVNDDSCGVQSQLTFESDGSTTYYISVGGFGSSSGNYDLDVSCLACFPPENIQITNIEDNSVDVSWDAEQSAVLGYQGIVVPAGAAPTFANAVQSGNIPPNILNLTVNGLEDSTAYDLYMRSICSPDEASEWSDAVSFATLVPNDDVCDAITLTVDAVSAGDAYSTVGATAQTDEPNTNLNDGVNGSVWFKFVAPAYGNVQITTDIVGGTMTDSEIALYSTGGGCGDFSSFTQVEFDQDGGFLVSPGFMSIINAYGLNPGETYYVQVDRWGTSSPGTFGIEVRDLSFVYNMATGYSPSDPSGTNNPNSILYVENGTAVISASTNLLNTVVMPQGVLDLDDDLNSDVLFMSSAMGSGQLADATGASVNGDATVQRYIPAQRGFRLLASSVTTSNSIFDNWQEGGSSDPGFGTHITGVPNGQNGFDMTDGNFSSLYTFDSDNQLRVPVDNTDTNTLSTGEGYILFVRGDRTIDLFDENAPATETKLRATGELAIGTQSVPMNNMNTALHYIANPYQATVDFSSVSKSGLNGFIYVYDSTISNSNGNGGFVTVELPSNGMTSAPNPNSNASYYIAPGQAFVVRSDGNPSTMTSITFEESDKVPTMPQMTVFDTYDNFYINSRLYKTNDLQNGLTESDAIGIRFGNEFTTIGSDEDALKVDNPNENYAIINNGNRSLDYQGLPSDGHVVDLFVSGYTETNYSFTFDFGNLPSGMKVYLADNYLNTQNEINTGVTYNFDVDNNIPESMATDRFNLVFEMTTLGVNNNSFDGEFKLFPNPIRNGQFSILTPNLTGDVDIQITNILGQQVSDMTLKVQSNEVRVNAAELTSGVYILQLSQDNKTYITKFVVE